MTGNDRPLDALLILDAADLKKLREAIEAALRMLGSAPTWAQERAITHLDETLKQLMHLPPYGDKPTPDSQTVLIAQPGACPEFEWGNTLGRVYLLVQHIQRKLGPYQRHDWAKTAQGELQNILAVMPPIIDWKSARDELIDRIRDGRLKCRDERGNELSPTVALTRLGINESERSADGNGQTAKTPSDSAEGQAQKLAGVGIKPKRSTVKGEGRSKLIAALTKHHRYADGGCLNLEPIGNNELARQANVSESTAHNFFNEHFNKGNRGGHKAYKRCCEDPTRIAFSLKVMNGEFTPGDLFCNERDSTPDRLAEAREDERDDEFISDDR